MPDEVVAVSGQVLIGVGADSSETPFPAYYRTGRSTADFSVELTRYFPARTRGVSLDNSANQWISC